jgi:hypothetical protein
MKKNRVLFSVLLACIAQISVISQSYDDFYYTKKGKIYLKIISNKYMVEFPNGVDENLFLQNNINYQKIGGQVYYVTSNLTTIQNVFGQSYFINPVYETVEGGYVRKILNEIILRYKAGVDETAKNNLVSFYNLQEIKATQLYNRYKVNNSLQISKAIYETGLVDYCHPVFVGTPPTPFDGYIPNDTYFNKQFYLNNTGQQINDGHTGTPGADIKADEAWEITKGSEDIIIAVIDDGLLADHLDIPIGRQLIIQGSNICWNYLPENLNNNPDDPSPVDRGNSNDTWVNHGNACAGIVGAEQDNNEGISGVAPLCKIMPVRIIYWYDLGIEPIYLDQACADAITFAAVKGANVISCSWGYPIGTCNAETEIIDAIEDAINNYNCVVVFATGNSANHYQNDNGYVSFPANSGVAGLITVGASDRYDDQANYSPSSEQIDCVAPSNKATPDDISGESVEVWSIDYNGDDGRNPWPFSGWNPPAYNEILPSNLSYTGRFGGTSAAAPRLPVALLWHYRLIKI